MISGVGTDIIEVDRIAEKISRGQGFRELVFAEVEISYCEQMAHKYQHYAARFAAKEALLKALGTGWISGTAFNEMIVERDENGRPFFIFTGTTAATLGKMGLGKISVSLSHVKTTATAIVIIEA